MLAKVAIAMVACCEAAPLFDSATKWAPGQLRLPMEVLNPNEDVVGLLKRDTILEVPTDIHQVLLTFQFTLADQGVTAVVDTGSFSSWLVSKEASQAAASALCASQSCVTPNSLITVTENDYSIKYMGEFGASGKWASAPLSINGVGPVDLKFGLADTVWGSPAGYAWCGFGHSTLFEARESQMLDVLKNGGVIDQRILALEYEPITSWADKVMGQGTLYLGGYDGDKDLIYLDVLSKVSSSVQFQSVQNNAGETLQLGYHQAVLFDSGSTNLLVKQEYLDFLFGYIEFDSQYQNFFKCSQYADDVVRIDVGGKILEIPLLNLSWNNYKDTHDLCQLMVSVMDRPGSFEMVLGQYVLKNLVTVIDVDSSRVGLAANAEGVTLI